MRPHDRGPLETGLLRVKLTGPARKAWGWEGFKVTYLLLVTLKPSHPQAITNPSNSRRRGLVDVAGRSMRPMGIFAKRPNDGVNFCARQIHMRHQPGSRSEGGDDAAAIEMGLEAFDLRRGDFEINDVGLRRRYLQTALAQSGSQVFGIVVILGKPLHVILERI